MNYTAADEDEVELNLKDMLIYVLLHWRSILLIAAATGLLVGGYKAYSAKFDSQSEQTVVDKLQDSGDDYASRLQAAKGLQQAIDATNRQLAQKTKYMDHSILMQIDPDKEAIASADIMLTVPGEAPENAIRVLEASYQSRLLQGDYLDALAKEMNTEISYLTELVSIHQNNLSGAQQNSIVLENSLQTSNLVDSFTISVTGNTQAQADRVLDAVVKEMNQIMPDVVKSITNHTVTVTHRFENTVLDQDLMAQQVKAASDIATLQQNIETYQKNLKDIDLESKDSKAGNVSSREIIKVFLKWSIVSGMAILLIGCAVYGMLYILSAFLITQEQLLARYPVLLLGTFRMAEEKLYRNDMRLDRWLRKAGNYGDKNPSWDKVLEMIIANLSVYAAESQTILISSAADIELSNKIQQELSKRMKNKKFILANQLETNAVSRMSLTDADGIVLVEKFGESRFRQVDQELAIIRNAKKTVLGVIME